jgi:hypothetical protein
MFGCVTGKWCRFAKSKEAPAEAHAPAGMRFCVGAGDTRSARRPQRADPASCHPRAWPEDPFRIEPVAPWILGLKPRMTFELFRRHACRAPAAGTGPVRRSLFSLSSAGDSPTGSRPPGTGLVRPPRRRCAPASPRGERRSELRCACPLTRPRSARTFEVERRVSTSCRRRPAPTTTRNRYDVVACRGSRPAPR